MLRLNLILNNLVHSIQNIIQGNTLLTPYHKVGDKLMTFDYIVSNPPFKLDFSDYVMIWIPNKTMIAFLQDSQYT